MNTNCVKCKKDIKNIDPKIGQKITDCSDCKNKKSRFVKEQETKGLLSNLGIKTHFSKIPVLDVLF